MNNQEKADDEEVVDDKGKLSGTRPSALSSEKGKYAGLGRPVAVR